MIAQASRPGAALSGHHAAAGPPACGLGAEPAGKGTSCRPRLAWSSAGFASVRDLYHCGRTRHNWHYVVPTWRSHLLASMAHRVAKGLVGGCALLLGVTVTGCGAPQYTYVANSSQSTYFKVPHGWHQISGGALQKAMEAVRYPARCMAGRVRGGQVAQRQRLPVLRRGPAVRVRRDRHAHLGREPGPVLQRAARLLPAGHLHRAPERARRVTR